MDGDVGGRYAHRSADTVIVRPRGVCEWTQTHHHMWHIYFYTQARGLFTWAWGEVIPESPQS